MEKNKWEKTSGNQESKSTGSQENYLNKEKQPNKNKGVMVNRL